MLESEFQRQIIRKLKQRFPNCIVLKNDANYLQGIPDLLVLCGSKWATLEVKRSSAASLRPNQQYYVDLMNRMSYSSIIHPQNEEVVFDELEQLFLS